MGNAETLDAFTRAEAHIRTLFRAEPNLVACDSHPGYLSASWADRFAAGRGLPLVTVQHHHAHAASAMLENGLDGSSPVIAIVFDGTGYGTDGAIWGGEVLLADYQGFRRLAHLKYVPLPGGDAAVRRPYRAALAHLRSAGIAWDEDLPCVKACHGDERRVLLRQLERGLNCVPTSSMGRLFDAAAALLGVRQTVSYEAQAAIEMEALCGPIDEDCGAFSYENSGESRPLVFDPAPVLLRLAGERRRGVPVPVSAGRFHGSVALLVVELARRARDRTGASAVALSGGVFQNGRLLERSVGRLRDEGFDVLVHRRVPANDGGLALGQAAVAWARASCV
jgi:hydrogenase maturation protein HypF